MNTRLVFGGAAVIVAVVAIALAGRLGSARVELVPEEGGGGTCYVPAKGVTCEVICNGACPVPPTGWILSESTGLSQGYELRNMAGRCTATEDITRIGQERLCCYFQANSP